MSLWARAALSRAKLLLPSSTELFALLLAVTVAERSRSVRNSCGVPLLSLAQTAQNYALQASQLGSSMEQAFTSPSPCASFTAV